MKQAIKELLDEMTCFGKRQFEKKSLKSAYEKIEFNRLSMLIDRLLHWQKAIKHNRLNKIDFFSDYFLLDDDQHKKFVLFFKVCPALSEVFHLNKDRGTYNPALSDVEKQEILDYIDANHTITLRYRVRRP